MTRTPPPLDPKRLVIGCPKCGEKRPLWSYALRAQEAIRTDHASDLDKTIACWARGCRLRNAWLYEATTGMFTLPDEKTPRKVITYSVVDKRITLRRVLTLSGISVDV